MDDKNIKPKFRIERQTLLLIIIFIVLMFFFSFTEKGFLTGRSISSMAFQLPEIGILSLAMMVTVMIGGINLSVNATANLSAVLAGFFILRVMPQVTTEIQSALLIGSTILIALATGLLTGAINGYLVGHIGAPPILASLASMTVFTGVAVGLTKGQTVTGFPEQIGLIGSQDFFKIPIPFLVFVGVTVIAYILLNHTTFGFKTRMLGTNPIAAKFSGIDNKAIIMKVFIFSGLLSSVAGVLVMSRTMSAAYQYGASTYVMLTILIYVLAGVVSGSGNVINVFITVLILQITSTGFHMLLAGVRGSSFFKDFVWGVLLILIFIINYFSRGKRNRE
ncbi:MAG: ABC transporter permease [Anaerolineaceae bacterium]|nr:ABC transporter permease [Anaerolineaceae bacterium]